MDNWRAIEARVGGTSLAATAPEFKTTGRAMDGRWPQNDRATLAQDSRLGRRYILSTDISQFYKSIYTPLHSVGFALKSYS